MASELEIRVKKRTSDGELERRWKAARQIMKERGIDFLLIQNNSPIFGGNVRWFTDIQVHDHPTTIIFPREDEMTTITHGARPPAEPTPAPWMLRGVKKRLNLPYLNAYNYTQYYGAELTVNELKTYKNAHIGIVGLSYFSHPYYNYLTSHLETAKFEDVTDAIDELKAQKSEEEISDLRETCRMQDEAVDYIIKAIRPGRRDYEVRGDLIGKWYQMGGEEASVAVGSAPPDTASRPQGTITGNRVIQPGDVVSVLFETSGPGGQWGEFARAFCLGKTPQKLQEQFLLAQEMQKVTLKMMVPGANPEDIWNASNAFARDHGYPEERRIYAHGQGYDMMERPSLNPGETMILKTSMNIAVHPQIKSPEAVGWVCENYLVKEKDSPELLHNTQQKVFEI